MGFSKKKANVNMIYIRNIYKTAPNQAFIKTFVDLFRPREDVK